jgi:hypothetical protein
MSCFLSIIEGFDFRGWRRSLYAMSNFSVNSGVLSIVYSEMVYQMTQYTATALKLVSEEKKEITNSLLTRKLLMTQPSIVTVSIFQK